MKPISRRMALVMAAGLALPVITTRPAAAAARPSDILRGWYGLVLKLVRHTATYSPPVASRAFGYLGVIAFEAAAAGNAGLQTLAGQLNGLTPPPKRESDLPHDDAAIIDGALALAVKSLFANTGPTGQRVLTLYEERSRAYASEGLDEATARRSREFGEAIARHVLAWAESDGGAVIENMGFPDSYALTEGKAHWVPTSAIRQQQAPLLPGWGGKRTFVLKSGADCDLPPPPAYSEDKDSEFYRQALEVYAVRRNLTQEQRLIARFWSDDPMLSPTPPGHWISIALQLFESDNTSFDKSAEVLALLGIAVADAFVACWHSKFEHDLLRPVTYIRRVIDPKWEPLLITPPFPEYPSGHSTQSGAAATVLTQCFGENFAFTDATHVRDKIPARSFTSFWHAAEEAGISRLYGGIHFRAAIDLGLDQGRCVGEHVNRLRTRQS